MAADPPSAPITSVLVETTNEQGAASCATSREVSFTTTVVLRASGSGLAATRKDTFPSPCPDAGELIVIQFACVEAVHVHSRGAPTVAVPVPPGDPNTVLEAESVAWHRATTLGLVTLDVLELPQPTKIHGITEKATTTGHRAAMRAVFAQRSPYSALRRQRQKSDLLSRCPTRPSPAYGFSAPAAVDAATFLAATAGGARVERKSPRSLDPVTSRAATRSRHSHRHDRVDGHCTSRREVTGRDRHCGQ